MFAAMATSTVIVQNSPTGGTHVPCAMLENEMCECQTVPNKCNRIQCIICIDAVLSRVSIIKKTRTSIRHTKHAGISSSIRPENVLATNNSV